MKTEPDIHVCHTSDVNAAGPPKATHHRIIDLLDFQWKAALFATPVALKSEDHGQRHWRDVARVGWYVGLANDLNAEQMTAIFCFAAIHDTQRLDEFYDPDHGERAAEAMEAIATDQHQTVMGHYRDLLARALVAHDAGERTTDPLIGSCWDADRLTIGRVGKTPSIEYMSTTQVRGKFEDFVRQATAVLLGDDETWFSIAERYASL